ncbi:ATP-binding response regulator [Tahibacter amnicola]|uniref:histidine kinase n=1 Tax=Tahibacter amnicola TaxID=2976241 RepID=A0ABY6BF35_9GAMM|nr:response regulator [Tahibacter amnicola]UXI68364.1 response regulator [Tahibacter amnicola]
MQTPESFALGSSWLWPMPDGEATGERNYNLSRIVAGTLIGVSFLLVSLLRPGNPAALQVAAVCAAGVLAAAMTLGHVFAFPAPSAWRRSVAVIGDTAFVGGIVALGGENAIPLLVLLPAIAVDAGRRFGLGYLAAASASGTVLFALAAIATDYWAQRPLVVMALIFAQFLITAFAGLFLAQLNRARREVVRLSGEKDRFITMMGNEIRNPLNAIVGNADLLLHEALPPEQRESVQVIRSQSDRLRMLATNLLGYFDASSTVPRQAVEFDLTELLDSVREGLLPLAFERRIRLDIHEEAGCPWRVTGDPQILRQIVGNILAHALGVTDHGRVEMIVHALDEGDAARGILRLSVSDTAPALSPAACAALFEPFGLQGHTTLGNPPGTGLNLCNARRLATALGGSVDFTSYTGGGGRYRIVIPAQVLDTLASRPARTGPAAAVVRIDDLYVRHRARVRPQRILVAEDQPSNQQMLSSVLDKAGHHVFLAKTGDQAMERLARERFDVVLVDLRLPGTNGLDVMKLVRFSHADRYANVPFLVLTGEASERTRQACMAAGAAAFLIKPASPHALLDALSQAVEGARRQAGSRVATTGDTGPIRGAVARSTMGGAAPRVMTEALRDALRYVERSETAARAGNWKLLRDLASAIRGAVDPLGAVRVIAVCGRIIEAKDITLEDLWPQYLDELNAGLNEASDALARLFRRTETAG